MRLASRWSISAIVSGAAPAQSASPTGPVIRRPARRRRLAQRSVDHLDHRVAFRVRQKARNLVNLGQVGIQAPGPGAVLRLGKWRVVEREPRLSRRRPGTGRGALRLAGRRRGCRRLGPIATQLPGDVVGIEIPSRGAVKQIIRGAATLEIQAKPAAPFLAQGPGHRPSFQRHALPSRWRFPCRPRKGGDL